MTNIGVGVATLGNVTAHATASLRSNFAIHHLRAAVRSARNAFEVEQANLSADHGPWFDEMMISVPVSVAMAAAALEANANEIIQDIVDGISPLPLTEGSRLLLKDLKDDRSGNSRDKYRRLALICDKLPNMGSVAWHDADLLIRLRNSLMHFKPAWDYEDDVHESKLIKSLREKVPTYRAYTDCFIFPYGLLTYGCARWSVESVLIFAGMFSAMVGVQNKFVAAHLDFSLPSVRSV